MMCFFQQWREITDMAPFIIITFGSIAKTIEMPKEMQQSLFRSFKFFPQFTFIVKYENITKEIQKYSENVYLAKWLPQIDLICMSFKKMHKKFMFFPSFF